jgi:hypothetical protein
MGRPAASHPTTACETNLEIVMSSPASRLRLARLIALTAALLVVGASTSSAHDDATASSSQPAASASPAGSSPPPVSAPPASLMAGYPALPDQIAVIPPDIPTVSVPPGSVAGTLVVGSPVDHELGHCGLWSPVDLDGSLWQPIGGQDANGAAIASDESIGELINATPGQFVLLTPDSAEFRSITGTVVAFTRAPGELDYPLCL